MTQDAPSIKAAILAKLTAAVDLSAIKKWLKAEPIPTRYPTSPFGWVEYNGGPRKPSAGTKEVFDDFFVVLWLRAQILIRMRILLWRWRRPRRLPLRRIRS